ncbi:hypothetical protein GCM10017771_74930 [Streptomyces capitiformicae]|uniref:Uncharacterized protein n=1 Tax=Streptomyces capitiformicae TaxID=2014920 RepID=A0A919DKV2_9ACTN|nr:hypothetical protein GCM10017771_74930 [Streptomyces capitiformicae]
MWAYWRDALPGARYSPETPRSRVGSKPSRPYWPALGRQVRVRGPVTTAPAAEAPGRTSSGLRARRAQLTNSRGGWVDRGAGRFGLLGRSDEGARVAPITL